MHWHHTADAAASKLRALGDNGGLAKLLIVAAVLLVLSWFGQVIVAIAYYVGMVTLALAGLVWAVGRYWPETVAPVAAPKRSQVQPAPAEIIMKRGADDVFATISTRRRPQRARRTA